MVIDMRYSWSLIFACVVLASGNSASANSDDELSVKNATRTTITIWVRPQGRTDWLRPSLRLEGNADGKILLPDPGLYFLAAVDTANRNRQCQSGWRDLHHLMRTRSNAQLLVQPYRETKSRERTFTVFKEVRETKTIKLPDGRVVNRIVSHWVPEKMVKTYAYVVNSIRFAVRDGDSVVPIEDFLKSAE